jgi:hypothetical protein
MYLCISLARTPCIYIYTFCANFGSYLLENTVTSHHMVQSCVRQTAQHYVWHNRTKCCLAVASSRIVLLEGPQLQTECNWITFTFPPCDVTTFPHAQSRSCCTEHRFAVWLQTGRCCCCRVVLWMFGSWGCAVIQRFDSNRRRDAAYWVRNCELALLRAVEVR